MEPQGAGGDPPSVQAAAPASPAGRARCHLGLTARGAGLSWSTGREHGALLPVCPGRFPVVPAQVFPAQVFPDPSRTNKQRIPIWGDRKTQAGERYGRRIEWRKTTKGSEEEAAT